MSVVPTAHNTVAGQPGQGLHRRLASASPARPSAYVCSLERVDGPGVFCCPRLSRSVASLEAAMLTVSPHTVAYVFGIIFIAELPDKTALASLVLATRYRARDVIIGAWLAFLVQTAVAVAAGSLLQLLPTQPVHLGAGVGFLVFAVLALRRREGAMLAEEKATVA